MVVAAQFQGGLSPGVRDHYTHEVFGGQRRRVCIALDGSAPLSLPGTVMAVLFWRPQYTLSPSFVGKFHGEAHSSSNWAPLYSGEMWGGIFGGAVAGWLVPVTSWKSAFAVRAALAVGAGIAALALRAPDATTARRSEPTSPVGED